MPLPFFSQVPPRPTGNMAALPAPDAPTVLPTPPGVAPSRKPAGAPRTLSDLFTRYQADHLSDRTANTQYQARQFFQQVLQELGDLPLSQVTADILRDWKIRLSQRCAHGTVHKYLVRLHAPFRAAVEEYCWLPANPLAKVQKPAMSRGRVRFLSVEERQRLLAACQHATHPMFYPFVLTALTTGGRKNEVRCLRWSEVDVETGLVRFLRTKTHQARSVPLTGEALERLRALARTRQAEVPWVFANQQGTAPFLMEHLWQLALREAGIRDFRFHDLRHTFSSYLAMSGASLVEIAEVLGHKTLAMVKRYAHLSQAHTAGVVERMALQFIRRPLPQRGGAEREEPQA
jgi:integrase